MNLEQLAAQQARASQAPQNAPQTQEAEPVDVLAARLDADRLYSLMVQTQEAIEDKARPADLAQMMTGALFGADSPQAAAVEAIIDADKHPGGHEMALATIRAQRQLLRQQIKQLEQRAKDITGELEKLDEADRATQHERMAAQDIDRALLDVLTLYKLKGRDPQPDILQEAAAILDKHRRDPAAMGLLYGFMVELTGRGYRVLSLDLAQQQEFDRLKAEVLTALNDFEH